MGTWTSKDQTIFILLVFTVVLLVIVGLFVNGYRVKFKALRRQFNFRITDVWAAIVGLSPSMLVISYFVNEAQTDPSIRGRTIHDFIAACIAVITCQIAGLAVGRMDIEIRNPDSGPISAWASAVSIVTGSVIGIFVGSLVIGLVVLFFGRIF